MELLGEILELPFLGGAIFMVAALVMYVFPPRKINSFYGYRTSGSMKSQERWEFAQQYSTKIMAACGFAMLLISFIGTVISVNAQFRLGIGIGLMLLTCFVLLFYTEKALTKKFPNQ